MPVLSADGLVKSFGLVKALNGVSFAVEKGEIFGLVGPDGSGKTTTMRILASILDPDAGSAEVMGFSTVRAPEMVKEHIGYMSQRFGLYTDLTVMENIDFYADLYGVPKKSRGQKIDRLLAFSNLAPFRKRLAGRLSGGMKQKLGLACALVHTPDVLLLDEPTNGVDPVSRRDFWRILYSLLQEGVSIFVSTAYLDEAERCSRVAMISQGRIIACDTPRMVKGMMRSPLLEIKCAFPRRCASLLSGRVASYSIGIFGDTVHIAVDNAEMAAAQIDSILTAAEGVKPQIRLIAPSLEDVFISVLGSGGEAGGES